MLHPCLGILPSIGNTCHHIIKCGKTGYPLFLLITHRTWWCSKFSIFLFFPLSLEFYEKQWSPLEDNTKIRKSWTCTHPLFFGHHLDDIGGAFLATLVGIMCKLMLLVSQPCGKAFRLYVLDRDWLVYFAHRSDNGKSVFCPSLFTPTTLRFPCVWKCGWYQ